MISKNTFVEVDFVQRSKAGQGAAGDVFMSHRFGDDDRTVCVLADGLGSGIKANVLATLTATMALKYIQAEIDIREASEIIMSTLPVCSKRKVGYSTFTIIDIKNSGHVKITEYGNPPYVLLRGYESVNVEKECFEMTSGPAAANEIFYSSFEAKENDKLVFFTDGVSQSGMGTGSMPLGWTSDQVEKFLEKRCREIEELSAKKIARSLVEAAWVNDAKEAKDDISCGVVNFRRPRKLIVVTGPAFNTKNDSVIAKMVAEYGGRKAICGGTTAGIIARELGRSVMVDISDAGLEVPPMSLMSGVDLITEGTITLGRAVELLEKGIEVEQLKDNAAVRLVRLLLESDIIEFIVGTRINEAHQDPSLPEFLDIRRNLMKRMIVILREKYMKNANIKFF